MKVKKISRSRRKFLWKKQRKISTKIWRMLPWGSDKKTFLENEVQSIRHDISVGFEVVG